MKYLFILLFISTSVYADKNLGLPIVKVPIDNPQSAEKIALGKLLFNDKRFSSGGSISCASCHQKDKAFTDGLSVAKGIGSKLGVRNSPTIINAAYFDTLFLDGRENSLEAQAIGPFLNPIEHGLESKQQILDVILNDNNYIRLMTQAFDILAKEISVDYIVKAISSYERTLVAGNSAFDQYYFGRDRSKLSASAARGLLIFRRKGNCANCHEISLKNALFTDNRFYNIGWGFDKLKPILDNLITAISTGKTFPLSEKKTSELGRFNTTRVIADIGKFKTPTLRNIALTAPYMHDGSVKTLTDVVEYYDKGGVKNRFLDAAIFPLHLTEQEKQDLVAFMESLTSTFSMSW